MTKHICNTCLFSHTCNERTGCVNYSPVGDAAEDAALYTYIEDRRIEFNEAWYQYISEDFE